MQRPWPALGIGWILALVVFIVWLLVLLGVLPESRNLAPLSFLALALALLL